MRVSQRKINFEKGNDEDEREIEILVDRKEGEVGKWKIYRRLD